MAVVGHLNWVLGWLLFQLLGFAWKDGLLGKVHHIAVLAVVMWSVAYALVKLGPWPQAMVHIPGMTHSPTHPPSVALVLFGLVLAVGHGVLHCRRVAIHPSVPPLWCRRRQCRRWRAAGRYPPR